MPWAGPDPSVVVEATGKNSMSSIMVLCEMRCIWGRDAVSIGGSIAPREHSGLLDEGLWAVETMFAVGDVVALRSDPETVFSITRVIDGAHESRYQVLEDYRLATYHESQLQAHQAVDDSCLLGGRDLRVYLTGMQLWSPSSANLYSS